MSVSRNSDGKVIAWDPKSPATLLVPTITESNSNSDSDEVVDGGGEKKNNNNKNTMVMNYMLCDDGSGCNTFESSAIMNLLDARDAYLDGTRSMTNGAHHHQALRQLSRDYRKTFANCISDWSDDLEKRIDESEEELQQQQEDDDDDVVHLELLRATYAVTHLSEIFLLLPSSQEDHNTSSMINTMGYGYENDMMNLPGAVTADTVRYLRKHHFGDIQNIIDPSVVEELNQLWQPDQYGHDNNSSSAGNGYWELVETYMVWGCLEDAWALLSRHSIVRRFVAMEEDSDTNGLNDYQAASLAEDREGFRALKAILLSAPLPGARNNASDEGFGDYENENTKNDDDQYERNGNDNDNDHPAVVEEELIEGIPTSAHRLWETSSGTGSTNNSRTGGYHSVGFEPNAAYQIHQHWKQAIGIVPSLQSLRRRIPQLNRLLNLLVGNFRDIEFGSWQEELCAELLYKNPNIRLVDVNVRASALVQKHAHERNNNSMNNNDNAGNDMIDDMVLNIMRGNAGEVVKAMHGFGGGSGAALPAVMTSLLSQLLGDANLLPYETSILNTELLIGASSAIRSSLATEGYHDLGTRLAVRLLLPHIEIDSDLRITATLVDTLEHHSPKSDAEANSLLLLCRKLIERKNVRVLDGCDSICLARYLHYIGEHIPGGAVHWLLTGIDLESLVLCEGPNRSGDWQRALASGVCYRRLVVYFTETSRSLIKTLLGEEKGASLLYARAKEMVTATKEESANNNNLTSFVPAVKLLENIIVIAGAIVDGKENSIVANSIVSCLEERPNDEDDGVVSSLARSLNWDLLRLAIEILDMDTNRVELQENKDKSNERSISSFDVRGMGVLLSVFTMETKAQELKERNNTGITSLEAEEDLQRTRLILGEGLKRAFVTENSMKRAAKSRRSMATGAGIYAANFSKHSREEQERAVQILLQF